METLERAANAIRGAEALLFTAGAGIGVDSGLPDFRGDSGFWKAYPPFQELRLSFVDLANPHWFERDPHLAWGFYGHRLNLYRATTPHAGFAILKRWSQRKPARSLYLECRWSVSNRGFGRCLRGSRLDFARAMHAAVLQRNLEPRKHGNSRG